MDSKNQKTNWLQKHLMPVAAKLGQNTGLISLRDGITLAMPLIIVGSFFMIISSFPIHGWIDWLARNGILFWNCF